MAAQGEMGQLIRSFDWSATSLGPIDRWPQSLKTSVSLILNAQMPMWLGWGPDMVFFYNDAYVQVLSHSKHPWALGRPARDVWAEIWDICGPLADRVFRDGQAPFVEDVQLFMDRGGGFLEEVYYSFSYSPIEVEDGSIGGLFCPNTEVTAKILNARRLRTLSDLAAKALVEKTTSAAAATAASTIARNREDIPFALLYLADARAEALALEQVVGIPSGHHEQLSPHWPLERVFRAGETEIVAVPANDVVPPGLADQRVQQAIVLPIAAPGHARPLGVLVAGMNPTRHLDAEYKTFYELVATQVGTALQNALSVEEEKRRADALAELDRVKTTFFSNVSHEFRTPLTLMLGPTEDALDSPERVLRGESLETVYRNELRLLKLVNALLDFSRIEAGRMQANYEAVDLTELTADLASGFRAAIEKAGLRFDVDAAPLSTAVLVDRQMWEKIVLNLLSNALKFTLEGAIAVTLRPDGNEVVLTVADTGTGIPAEQLPRLFERFHRVENTAARTHEGSGIGLALVHELAKLHGGSVTVASVLGEGSQFTVRIPLVPAHGTAVARGTAPGSRTQAAFVVEAQRWVPRTVENAPQPRADGRGYVLLADDNADMREYVERLLQEHWRVVTVSDGNAALEAARTERPDLVLSDIMMPGLDGFGLLQALRSDERLQHVPVILLSARAGSEAHVEGLAAGADDYLVKPFSARELVARVRTHLALGQARQAATEHFAELYALLMQVPATITVRRGPDLRCVFQNAAAQQLGEQRGLTLAEWWPGRTDYLASYQHVMRTGETIVEREISAERQWMNETNVRRRYWDATYSPLRLPDGTIDGVISISFEVTDRVEARAQLDVAETRRRLAFDAANIGTWHIDLLQNIRSHDAAASRILGLPDQDSTPSPLDFITRVHPAQRPQVEAALQASLERGAAFDEEFQVVRPDGSVRWVHGSGQVIRDGRQPIAFTGVVADVTSRREAEEQSELARKRLEAALQAGDIGTYFWDVRSNSVEHDASVKRLFGLDADHPHPIDAYTERVHDADRAEWLAKLEVSARDGADFHMEYRVALPDGTVRWLLDKAQMNRDVNGVPSYMTGAVVDITEQKRLAEAALAASRAKDEFLAMLGHELRNPLAPMTTAIELMKMRGGELTKELRVIERQVQHLGRLVDDLLDISRVTRGLIELKRQRVEIKDALQKALEMASPLIEQKRHRISLTAPAGLVVDGDPTRLAQIFSNLLTNAARYTGEQGRIDILAERAADGRLRIAVTDTGMGIRADMVTRIFELFEQGVNSGLSRGEGGLGIGLALVRSLVRMHGGDVTAHSEGPGKGSTFEVVLPAIQEATASTPAHDSQPPPSTDRGRRILVVDDNEDAAFLLSEMLRTIGHEVVVAHDAAQALAVAGDYQPDTAILDIGLPAMDGYELGRTLRESGRGPRTMIALTGYGQERDRNRSQQAGFDAHLVKPVNFAKLVEALGT